VWIDSSVSAIVSACKFQQNRAQMYGGAIQNAGATSLTIQGTRFIENSNLGGAGGAVSLERGTTATAILSCQFSGNTAAKGGAVSSNLAPVRIAHSAFEANAAQKPDDAVDSCSLSGANGGALLLTAAKLVPVAGLPVCTIDRIQLENLTFRSNTRSTKAVSGPTTHAHASVALRRAARRGARRGVRVCAVSVPLVCFAGSIQLDFNNARTTSTCGLARPLAPLATLCQNCSFDANVASTGPIISSPPKAFIWPNESADESLHDSDVAFSVQVGVCDAFGNAIRGGHDALKVRHAWRGSSAAHALRAPMCSVRAHVCMPRKRARLAVRCASLSTLRSS
jgi:predicted outer membrane repeat protein